ncbi:MAG TPA: PIG-L family deacetylase [Acidimicrobiales bacterium]|nr:PIG-L family deacetylase [Acidimicrobiales bacterium]
MPEAVSDSAHSGLVVNAAPTRALAVYAHPDDPEISCGGTLATWARAGTKVHVLICTRGEKGSSDPSVDVEKLARLRAREIAAAGKVLGLAGHAQLPINDGELENTTEVRALIVATIRRVRPDVIVCPDPTAVFFGESYYNHHDHRVVGWATLDSVAPAASNPHYFPDAGEQHEVATVFLSGTLEPNVWVDIGATMAQKIQALSCHKSQLGERDSEWVREAVEQRAREGGHIAGVTMAEGFRRLSLAG